MDARFVPLGEVLSPVTDRLAIDPSASYRLVTVRLRGQGLVVVPTDVVDKMRALVLGMGLSKLHSDGGLSCSIVRPS
jgi:hypothetical protein